jgi:hypothetical protein
MKRHLLKKPEHFAMLWRIQKLLYGLEFQHLALRRLAKANVLRMGFRKDSADSGRLHRLHCRLLPGLERNAALRCVPW